MELLTPGTGLIIWQLIIFLLLFFLLAKLAWKPILNSLKEREQSIQEALDTAEKARLEMSRLKADNENLLKHAREEREKMLRDAREASNRMKDEAQVDAKKAADRIIEDARIAINSEKVGRFKRGEERWLPISHLRSLGKFYKKIWPTTKRKKISHKNTSKI